MNPQRKKYRVVATMHTHLECEIEAENEEDALEIAKSKDGSEFSEIGDNGDWYINDVFEIDKVRSENWMVDFEQSKAGQPDTTPFNENIG